jgi:hypothetical protein
MVGIMLRWQKASNASGASNSSGSRMVVIEQSVSPTPAPCYPHRSPDPWAESRQTKG